MYWHAHCVLIILPKQIYKFVCIFFHRVFAAPLFYFTLRLQLQLFDFNFTSSWHATRLLARAAIIYCRYVYNCTFCAHFYFLPAFHFCHYWHLWEEWHCVVVEIARCTYPLGMAKTQLYRWVYIFMSRESAWSRALQSSSNFLFT